MAIETIEAVVPVRLSGARERLTGDRFGLLLESLSRHWSDPAPLRLTVVGMADDLARLEDIAGRRHNLALSFMDERVLIGDPRILALGGWFKQMFIKLLFVRVCAADAYLYLDADVVCVRRLSHGHFLQDGRVASGWEPKRTHPGWWASARRLLGRRGGDRAWGLGVTPNMLVRGVAEGVLDAVRIACGGDPLDALLAETGGDFTACWVENTIYGEFAEMTGDLDRWHLPASHPSLYRSGADLWAAPELATWHPLESLAAAPAARFVVAQSNTGIDPAYVRQRLAPMITGAPPAPRLSGDLARSGASPEPKPRT